MKNDLATLAYRPPVAVQKHLPRVSPDKTDLQIAQDDLKTVGEYVPDELILGVRDSAHFAVSGAEVFPFQDQPDVVRIKIDPDADLAQALASAREWPGVVYAEPNQIVRLREKVPNDLSARLWALKNEARPGADIDATGAWTTTTGSAEGPLAAVLDSGADYRHHDLAANVARNEGEIPGDGLDNDGNGVVDDVFGYNAFEDHGDPMDGMGSP